MTVDLPTICEAALKLSISERMQLAQALWDSVPAPPDPDSGEDSVTIAKRRARELEEHPQLAVPHEDVMQAVRKDLM